MSAIAADAATFSLAYNTYNGLVSSVTNAQSGVFAQYAFDDMDRLTSIVWRDGTNGVLRSFAYGHDAVGNVTNVSRESAAENVAYGHDSLDRLVSADASYLEADYYWDLAGNPTSRVEDGETNHHVYSGDHLLADVDADGVLLRSYVAGPGVDNWLTMTVHTGGTAKTYVYLTDHAGTVHALADEDGTVVESYRYDPWGRVLGVWDGAGTPLSQSAVGNRILFQGREYLRISG